MRTRTIPLRPHENTFSGTVELAEKAMLRRTQRLGAAALMRTVIETEENLDIPLNIIQGEE